MLKINRPRTIQILFQCSFKDRVECLVTAKGNLFHSDGPLWLKRAAHDLFIARVCFSRTPQQRVFILNEKPYRSSEFNRNYTN